MLINDDLLHQLSDGEALTLLSTLNLTMQDWPTLVKIGGAKAFLASSLAQDLLLKRRFLAQHLVDLRAKFDRFYEQGGFLITPLTHGPARVFRGRHAPLAFFSGFNQEIIFDAPVISIVGARNASSWGVERTRELAESLASHGVVVASGGARGIDQAAHRGALYANGKTMIVSGCAFRFLKIDPLIEEMSKAAEQVLIIYPYGPFLEQKKFMFVERNRIVASIADAVVVIEGELGSGSLHTARFAEEQNVPIYCLKRPNEDSLSFAPNLLITTGKARLLGNFDHFAQALVTKTIESPKKTNLIAKGAVQKSKETRPLPYLLQVINDHENSLSFDELLDVTGFSFGQLQRELLDYELDGRIYKQGSQFVLRSN